MVVSTLSHGRWSSPGAARRRVGTAGRWRCLVVRGMRLDSGSGGSVRNPADALLDEVVAPFRQARSRWPGSRPGRGAVRRGQSGGGAPVTTPLRSLLDATQRLVRTRHDAPLGAPGAATRSASWAGLDRMRVSIGTQQAEIRSSPTGTA